MHHTVAGRHSDWSRHQCVTSRNMHWSLSSDDVLPAWYWASGLCYMSLLQLCRRNGRAPDFAMPNRWSDSAGDVALPPNIIRPKTPLEQIGAVIDDSPTNWEWERMEMFVIHTLPVSFCNVNSSACALILLSLSQSLCKPVSCSSWLVQLGLLICSP